MYLPPHFSETRPEELARLIEHHPLGALVAQRAHGLDADHLPFDFDAATGVLSAHVARANPLWQECASGTPVLVIFRATDGYISPNWYPSKHEAHRQVPTWNYEVVHAHGVLTIRDDARFVRGLVGRLTKRHEAGEPRPWKMSDSAPEFIDQLLAAIVGIEIQVTSLIGKRKLSQNKAGADRAGAAAALRDRGQGALAQAMHRPSALPSAD
ncbi:Protease synthase and sporulation protein PAI 2 [compost metagenome]